MSFRGGRQNEEQEIMQSMLIKMTMSINKQCFTECVKDFGSDRLSAAEINCVSACAKRHSGAFAAMNDIQGQLSGKQGRAMF
jgi:Tim10/DDP family zinc finger